MPNMSQNKVAMPEQAPHIRNKNFKEVALGYTKEQAVEEAKRCLNCKNKPCMNGCPVHVRIPEFIEAITKEDFKKAYEIIKDTSSLPVVCGRVCPQETQCEKYCVRGIKGEPVAIGRLERFVADYCMQNEKTKLAEPKKNGKKVAVIGA
ncbi:MAG: dihydropyrimidine dehydrogenase, partial [Clostridia bacterium]|nr:dihydropyrimidine dehydrogenase [Clostridia bacterium]